MIAQDYKKVIQDKKETEITIFITYSINLKTC